MRNHMATFLATLLLSACSGTTGPIIDTQGVDMAKYQQDLAECETYATQVSTERAVGRGAAGGAAVGAAIGAIAGGNAGRGAGIGAVSGGAQSARISDREKADVVRNCLRGRGYRVLN
ncbi:MAG: glycine zipper family protein [Gammaproteobacteria bacterium]|nr:MAG: glycine zipper family protein [Gammaproteobacteria bacterium]